MRRAISLAAVVAGLGPGLVACSNQVSSGEAGPVATSAQDLSSGLPYLALGDSVPFGYNPVDAVDDPTDIHKFVGYPEVMPIAGVFAPYPIANAACEGETSASFISTSAPDNGCKAWRAAGDAMHVSYAGASESQLEFAIAYLRTKPKTATVSIQIGADDLLLLEYACEAAYDPSTDPNYVADVTACEEVGVPGSTTLIGIPKTIEAVVANIGYIAGALRAPVAEGGAGYEGQIVLVTYYALQYSNTSDPTFQASYGLGEAEVELAQAEPALNLSIARGFSSFAEIATALGGGDACKAGLLYKLSDGTCDKHPSLAGQTVLAADVAAAVPASQINLSASTPQF